VESDEANSRYARSIYTDAPPARTTAAAPRKHAICGLRQAARIYLYIRGDERKAPRGEENRVLWPVAVGQSLGATFPSFLASATIRESERPGQAKNQRGLLLMEYRGKGSDHDYEHAHADRERTAS